MAVKPVISNREPQIFSCGDTLAFRRCLPEFSSNDGWNLHYDLVTDAGAVALYFDSAADNGNHLVQIANWAAAQDPTKDYVFVGYAVNAGAALRQEVYRGPLILTPNFGSDQAQTTEAPFDTQAIEKLQEGLLRLYGHELKETDINRQKVVRVEREALRKELNFWEERRFSRRRHAMVRNGLPDPSLIHPAFPFSF